MNTAFGTAGTTNEHGKAVWGQASRF